MEQQKLIHQGKILDDKTLVKARTATKTALFRRVQRSDAPTWAQGVRSPVEGSRHVKTHPKESPIGLGTRLALRIGPLWATGLAHWAHLASRRAAAKGCGEVAPLQTPGGDRGSRLREPRAFGAWLWTEDVGIKEGEFVVVMVAKVS